MKYFFRCIASFYSVRAIGNLWSIYLGVDILSPVPCVAFIINILLLKVLKVNSGSLKDCFDDFLAQLY